MAGDLVPVDLRPAGVRTLVASGATLLDAARGVGVEIPSGCGGAGACGRCRVAIVDGTPPEPGAADRTLLTAAELAAGTRLACRVTVRGPLTVDVPADSRAAPGPVALDGPAVAPVPDPAVRHVDIAVPPPSSSDTRSDASRVLAAIGPSLGRGPLRMHPGVAAQLAPLARRHEWRLAAFIRGPDVVGFEAPGTPPAGLAVDLGTTKVAGYLVALESGRLLAAEGILNPQTVLGDDVIARLAHAARVPAGAGELARLVRTGLDELVASLARTAGIDRTRIADAAIVGNTAMIHLLLGLPTAWLSRAPFVAAAGDAIEVPSRELGIGLAPDARVHVLPGIGGFVGADHVAMIVGADLDAAPGVALGVDIGTNTEIALCRPGHGVASASCASGPAFEGGHIAAGMRAAPGAIERVSLGPSGAVVGVIGGGSPLGICGSGIVDAVAELLRTGRIDRRGRFRADAQAVRSGPWGRELVLVEAGASGTGRDIAITQRDVTEVQLAKGAIGAGIEALLESTATSPGEVERVVVAGAFGTYLDLESALAIGLLPRLPRARYEQVGNAAGAGARAALLSLGERDRAARVARDARYLELTASPAFRRLFARAMLFPDSSQGS